MTMKVQCSNKYAPWIDDEFVYQAKIMDELHNKAKHYDTQDDWRKRGEIYFTHNCLPFLSKTIFGKHFHAYFKTGITIEF